MVKSRPKPLVTRMKKGLKTSRSTVIQGYHCGALLCHDGAQQHALAICFFNAGDRLKERAKTLFRIIPLPLSDALTAAGYKGSENAHPIDELFIARSTAWPRD